MLSVRRICSIFVLTMDTSSHPPAPAAASGQGAASRGGILRPPAATPHDRLRHARDGMRVTVAGLVMVRQRPGTAKGVIFVTLEDETGIANIVVWAKVYETFRRAVVAGRLLRVTGRIQRDGPVIHVVAEQVEDMSHLLDTLASGEV